MEILEHDDERAARRNGFQHVADLAQHSIARGAQDLTLQSLATVGRQPGGKLDEPGGGLCRQDLDDGVSIVSTAEPGERFQHRVIGFFASVALDTLTQRDSDIRRLGRGLTHERVHHGGLADAGLSRDEDDLSLASRHLPETFAELGERALSAHEPTGHGSW